MLSSANSQSRAINIEDLEYREEHKGQSVSDIGHANQDFSVPAITRNISETNSNFAQRQQPVIDA